MKTNAHWALGLLLLTLPLAACPFDWEIDTDSDPEDSDDSTAELELGTCFNGMTTKIVALDPKAERCELNQLDEMRHYVCDQGSPGRSQEVCDFLTNTLKGHAKIQCTAVTNDKGDVSYCADVVDRYQSGFTLDGGDPGNATHNYFIAYADDRHDPLSPEVDYWSLARSEFKLPPVELSAAAYIDDSGQLTLSEPPYPHHRFEVALKFDPRDCPSCGIYSGPGFAYLTTRGQEAVQYSGWWPPFKETSCMLDRDPDYGAPMELPEAECGAEIMYRSTSR